MVFRDARKASDFWTLFRLIKQIQISKKIFTKLLYIVVCGLVEVGCYIADETISEIHALLISYDVKISLGLPVGQLVSGSDNTQLSSCFLSTTTKIRCFESFGVVSSPDMGKSFPMCAQCILSLLEVGYLVLGHNQYLTCDEIIRGKKMAGYSATKQVWQRSDIRCVLVNCVLVPELYFWLHSFMFLMLFCSNSVHFLEIQLVCHGRTDRRTDGPTDGRTDRHTLL